MGLMAGSFVKVFEKVEGCVTFLKIVALNRESRVVLRRTLFHSGILAQVTTRLNCAFVAFSAARKIFVTMYVITDTTAQKAQGKGFYMVSFQINRRHLFFYIINNYVLLLSYRSIYRNISK